MTNFPYQHCDNTTVQAQSQSGGNIKKFNYPILNKGNGRLCIPEDSYNIYSNKRPFPYNLIDYGEKNFDSESIKYLFRTIVIFILCFLIPLRYIFNKCFNKISNIYDKYISRNKLLSSIVFLLLPLSMPLISFLVLVSLAFSLILYCIYTLLSIIHNIFMLFNSVRFAENIFEAILCILGTGFTLFTLYLIIVAIFKPKHVKIEKDADGNYNNTDDRMLNEWFYNLPTLIKFAMICGSLILGVIFFGIKSTFFVGKDPMTNERTYNTYMEKWYKIIFYPFDYDDLRATQKEDLGNYRIDKEVNRPDIGKQVYKPLAKFLTIKKSKISVRTVLLLLFIITSVFYFAEKNKDPIGPASTFLGILMCLFFFNILLFLYSLLNKYLIYCKKYSSFNEIPPAVYFFSQELSRGKGARIFNNIIFFILAGLFGLFSVVNSEGTCPFQSNITQIQQHKQDGNAVNSLNILSQDSIDLSEVILLFKKMIYLICVSIILGLTSLTLPFVMIITLLFILFELLYIFLIVPFTKGGHFIFRIMRNRYKLLTYMLCTAVIIYIKDKNIFSSNTNTVVYTMSAILILIAIYNFVTE